MGEVLNLKWDSVDFERRLLRLAESTTGPKVVFLNEPALEILQHAARNSPAVDRPILEEHHLLAILLDYEEQFVIQSSTKEEGR